MTEVFVHKLGSISYDSKKDVLTLDGWDFSGDASRTTIHDLIKASLLAVENKVLGKPIDDPRI